MIKLFAGELLDRIAPREFLVDILKPLVPEKRPAKYGLNNNLFEITDDINQASFFILPLSLCVSFAARFSTVLLIESFTPGNVCLEILVRSA